MPKYPVIKLALENILATSETQPRTSIQMNLVSDYAEDLKNGAVFPPVIVFNEGEGSERYWLADGFHRLFAHRDADIGEIECEVHPGGKLEAKIYSLGANTTHGNRRTNADIRRAVDHALKDPEISKLSNQEIADICRVHRNTITNYKSDKASEERQKKKAKGAKPKEPTEEDHRESKPPPTQAEIDRDELLSAVAIIKGFPYGGMDADERMAAGLPVEDLEYACEWLSHAVLVLRKNGDN